MSISEPDVTRTGAVEVSGDILEPVLDTFLEAGILRDIPLLGTAIKLAQLSQSVSDRIFLTKIQRFLKGMPPIWSDEAADFAHKLDADPELAQRTGQTLLLSIDSINDFDKAPILALVFSAFLRSEIDRDVFLRLTAAVNQAMVGDLWTLADTIELRAKDEITHIRLIEALHALRITGLTSLSDTAFAFVGKRSIIGTEVTPLGQTLVQILRVRDRRAR